MEQDHRADPLIHAAIYPTGIQEQGDGGYAGDFKNAELRGEVRPERLTPWIISLPWKLLRNEIITKQEVFDTAIVEIVDDIFLPLIRAAQQ